MYVFTNCEQAYIVNARSWLYLQGCLMFLSWRQQTPVRKTIHYFLQDQSSLLPFGINNRVAYASL